MRRPKNFDDAQVRRIKAAIAAGATQGDIARRFGVSGPILRRNGLIAKKVVYYTEASKRKRKRVPRSKRAPSCYRQWWNHA